MTCIVGLKYDNKIFIGADSAGCADLTIKTIKYPKVFIRQKDKDKYIFGYTTSFRMAPKFFNINLKFQNMMIIKQ